MKIADETLMAFADGELDDAAAAAVAAAVRDDPAIAARVAEHRTLRARLQAAYADELAEPVPERLLAAAGQPFAEAIPKVAQITRARASRLRPRWRPALSIAASLLIGVAVGFFAWRQSDSIIRQDSRGALIAGGTLARALSGEFAGQRGGSVEIGLSFLSKSGTYCRTFSIRETAAASGLACRHDAGWQIDVLAPSAHVAGADSQYRTASSSLSPPVLQAVESQIVGAPLDHDGEIVARRRDWQLKSR